MTGLYLYNLKLMEACKTLCDYAEYTNRVRAYGKLMDISEAVERAITECIQEGRTEEKTEGRTEEKTKGKIRRVALL